MAGLQIESIIEYKVSTSARAEKEKALFTDVLIADGPVGEPGVESLAQVLVPVPNLPVL